MEKFGRTQGAHRNFPHICLGMGKVWATNIYGKCQIWKIITEISKFKNDTNWSFLACI
jgi:hypothetical protein